MRILLFTAIALFVSPNCGFAEEKDGSDKAWFEKDSTGRLQKTIAAFRVNYHRVRSTRHAFVCKGNWLSVRKGNHRESDIYYVGYLESATTKFYANSKVLENAARGRAIERWDQQLLHQGKLYRRWGPFSGDVRDTLSDKDEIRKAQREFVKFCPVGMSVSTAGNAMVGGAGGNSSAADWLTKGTLLSCTLDEEGNLVQVFEERKARIPVRAKIVWCKEQEFYPSRVDLILIRSSKDEEILQPFSTVATRWKKELDFTVPAEMVIASKLRIDEITIDVRYKFDQQLPKPPLLSVSDKDWREPLRVEFEETWQRIGVRLPFAEPVDKE